MGHDAAAIFIERDLINRDRTLRQHLAQSIPRCLGLDALLRAPRPEFGGVDAAQPHLGGDVESRPYMYPRLEGIAVDHAQYIGRNEPRRHERSRPG
jgi:hypothetical protein